MAVLVTQQLTDAGTKPTFVTATASDKGEYGNGTDNVLVVRNVTGGALTVTIAPVGNTEYGTLLPAKVVGPITATTGEAWIPLRKAYDNGDGNGTFTVTGATGASVAVVRL